MAGSAVIASAMRICSGRECSRPSDGHAPLVGGGEAGTGALTDHVALELGECGKDVKRELAGGCCRVDGFLEGP